MDTNKQSSSPLTLRICRSVGNSMLTAPESFSVSATFVTFSSATKFSSRFTHFQNTDKEQQHNYFRKVSAQGYTVTLQTAMKTSIYMVRIPGYLDRTEMTNPFYQVENSLSPCESGILCFFFLVRQGSFNYHLH